MKQMPIYEYDCASCGRRTEAIQRVGEKHLKVCPRCGGALKKAFSAPAIQFKGSGFYITDYSRGNKDEGGTAKKAGEAAEGSGGEKSDAKADAGEKKTETKEKPEKKPEKKPATDT
ncbi:MAG: FmdB family zinc ribbon protein [Thermoanaerobaculia bacterium]